MTANCRRGADLPELCAPEPIRISASPPLTDTSDSSDRFLSAAVFAGLGMLHRQGTSPVPFKLRPIFNPPRFPLLFDC